MKVAFVTGGASGLGAAIAQRLHADGFQVVISDIDQAGGQALVAQLGERCEFITLDVSSEDGWKEALAHLREGYGRLDVLVNNAGITTVGNIETMSFAALKREFSINLDSVFLGCQNAIGLMKQTGGSIINIASGCSKKVKPDLAGYNATKAAVTMLSKTIALHCAKQGYGIRVNTVHPGAMRPPIVDKVLAQSDTRTRCWPAALPTILSGVSVSRPILQPWFPFWRPISRLSLPVPSSLSMGV